MNNVFQPHGDFKLYVRNNVLVAHLAGTWNKECAALFSEEFKQTATPLIGAPWGHLVLLDDWELSVPEVEPIVTDLVEFCLNNGLKRSAQVYSESMVKKLLIDKMVVEKQGDFERQIFTNKQDAINWLHHEGFDAQSD